MKIATLFDIVAEVCGDDAVILRNPDYADAIIGTTSDGRVVYDFDRMVDCLVEEDGMTAEEAVEFIEYNTVRALPYAGARAPVIMYPIDIGGMSE